MHVVWVDVVITTNHLGQGQLEAVGVLVEYITYDRDGYWSGERCGEFLAALDAIADLIHEAPAFEPTATYTCPGCGCGYQAVIDRKMFDPLKCPNYYFHDMWMTRKETRRRIR